MTTTMTTPPPARTVEGTAAVLARPDNAATGSCCDRDDARWPALSTAVTGSCADQGADQGADAARRTARALHPAGRGAPGTGPATGASAVVDLASVRERSRPAHRPADQGAGSTAADGGARAADGAGAGAGAGAGDGAVVPLRARRPWRRWWHSVRRDGADAGMATAEYAVVLLAAVGFAGLLIVILTSSEIRELLTGLVRGALSV